MNTVLDNIHLALPEMIMLCTAVLALLADLFFKQRYKDLTFIIACFGLVLAGFVSFMFMGNFKTVILNGLYVADDLSSIMKLFIAIVVLFAFFYSRVYVSNSQMPGGEFYILSLLSTLGMMVMVSSHSMLTVYLGLELLSLPMYALTALQRHNGDSSEAAMKYFVMGAMASGMLLYGMSLIYGATGKIDLMDVANAVAVSWQDKHAMLSFALVFLVAGLGFKLAAVPFHMWAPDVYQGAPAPVTLLISSAPKIAALGMTLRLLSLGLIDVSAIWQQLILVIALLSTGIGNLFAIAQTNIRRMLAYSGISHVGFALFGVLVAQPAGFSAAVFYILVYAIMSAASFGMIVLLSSHGTEVNEINDLKGLNQTHPWLAFMMLIVMFSMAGVPPTIGFFTKMMVLKALIDVQMTWVAVLGLFFAVVGAYYYLRIVKVMYFDEPVREHRIQMSPFGRLVLSVNCLSLLYLGIFPTGLISACMAIFS